MAEQQPLQDTSMVVDFVNWMASKATVKDSKGNLLYNVEYHMRSPQIRFKHGDVDIGSATFHLFKTSIDITFRDYPDFKIKCTKFMKGTYSYSSPSFNGQTLTWKSASGWKGFDYVCEDETGQALGQFAADSYIIDSKKVGRLQFDESLITKDVDPVTASLRRDEILIIGSALAYWVKLNMTGAVA